MAKSPLATPPSSFQGHVTLLLFKDNLAARTFQVPLRWIARLGWLIGILFAVTLLCLVSALRYYRVAQRGDPARVRGLELELSDLRTSYHALEVKTLTPPASAPTAAATVATTAAPTATAPSTAPTASLPINVAQPLESAVTGTSVLFSALPPSVTAPSADRAGVPITVNALEASWIGRGYRVKFNLQYVREDKGNQQGRIIVIGRGPDALVAYPAGIFNPPGSASLITPDKGEYFSVSRFREVRAEFTALRAPDAITEFEVLIIGQNGQILVYDRVKPHSGHGGGGAAAAESNRSTPPAAQPQQQDPLGTATSPAATQQPPQQPPLFDDEVPPSGGKP